MSAIIIAPQGYPHAQAFAEVVESFNACLAELGVGSPGEAPTIVFGAHLGAQIHDDAIVFNTEVRGSPWMTPEYLNMLHEHRVWDYSLDNIEWLADHGVKAEHCPIGYHKCLERIEPAEQDIDVLFYGSMTPRRQPIWDAIVATGLSCKHLFGIYGQERDAYIARSKVVLNLHAYDNSPFEIIRCSYLFANAKVVVSEGPQGDWGGFGYFAEAERLPHLCRWACILPCVPLTVVQSTFRERHPQIEYLRRLLCN